VANERDEALQRAAEHIFSLGLDDAAAQLCRANMAYGLAKLHFLQRQMGLAADATFIGSPDMTITRNSARWAAGFGYGGKLRWGDGDTPLIVLDVKPNVCGMLVGGLHELPALNEVVQRIHTLTTRQTKLDGIPLTWDFAKGNHFIDVFAVTEQRPEAALPAYVFVMHCAAPEVRSSSEFGLGLYWDDSPALGRLAEIFQTPWGPLHILRDEAAEKYWRWHQFAEEFSCRRRLVAARHIFGDFEVISNTVHQKLLTPNEILLGCYDTSRDDTLLPFMLQANLPGYLMQGHRSLSEAQIEALGFKERAGKLGVLGYLQNANVLPHGAGYALPGLRRFKRVIEAGSKRYFVMESTTGREQIITDLSDIASAQYRGEEVLRRTLECGLGSVAATLQPVYVLKT